MKLLSLAATALIAASLLLVTGGRHGSVIADSPDAETVLVALRERDLPIGDYVAYTDETDPNELLGRPGQYTSKVNFRDTRLDQRHVGFDSEDGGSVEVFTTNEAAERRREYIRRLGEALPALVEYGFVRDGILVRLSRRLTPRQASDYEMVLNAYIDGTPITVAIEQPSAQSASPTPEPTSEATPTPSPSPTPPAPTATPAPTLSPTPTPTPAPTTASQPVQLTGRGQTATQSVMPPASVSAATFTHGGRSNFIVRVFQADSDTLLVNHIGPYSGSRPIFGTEPLTFDIRADGEWTVTLQPVGRADSAGFSGRGDKVSGLFDPPATGAWEFRHDGRSNFIVRLYCAGGSSLVQNEIGPVQGSRVVRFAQGPCLWEVRADGNWSLSPR